MTNGEKVSALMSARGWGYAETAAAVRAQGARTVKYQHIQQLVLHPTRSPRYLLELAAAFGMTAEQFRAWTPGKGNSKGQRADTMEKSETITLEAIAAEVRQQSLALVVLMDWLQQTRPAEVGILTEALESAAVKIGADKSPSTLALMLEAARASGKGKPGRAGRKSAV